MTLPILGASKAAFFIECPGAPKQIRDAPNVSHSAARRGTRLHHVYAEHPADMTPAERSFVAAARKLYSDIESKIGLPRVWSAVEMPLELSSDRYKLVARIDEIRGYEGVTLISDLKTGQRPVAARDNWQLIVSAYLAIQNIDPEYTERFMLAIVQPGSYKEIDTWEVTPDDLRPYFDRLEAAMEYVADHPDELRPGPHCVTCNANGHCPGFDDRLGMLDRAVQAVPNTVTGAALARKAHAAKELARLANAQYKSLEAEISTRIRAHESIPGAYLVEQLGPRRWRPDATPEAAAHRYKVDLTTIQTPTYLERALRQRGLKRSEIDEILTPLVERPRVGETLKLSEIGN